MNLWFVLILGCLVGILYLNIMEELKIGKDLEILEMDYVNNQYLQETLRVKQPFIFQMQNGWVLPDSHYFCSFDLANFSSKYGKEKMVVYESWQKETVMNMENALPLIFLQEEDGVEGEGRGEGRGEGQESQSVSRWSENNGMLVEETPLKRYCQSCDSFLAPYGTVDTEYDYWVGRAGATLPVRHHNRHSYFLLVLEGEIAVQLALAKSLKTDGNVWNDYVLPEPLVTAKEVDSEVHWMEVQVGKGQCLSIPPWWWHETRFLVDSQVVVFMYDNAVNSILNKCREYHRAFFKPKEIVIY